MSPTQYKQHAATYRFLDRQAAHAYVLGDEHTMDLYLESRNAVGTVIREAHYASWKRLHDARFFTKTHLQQPA
jgi:hypothetical protein